MANRKTSELPVAGTMDGSELLAIVQAGTDSQIQFSSVVSAMVGPLEGALEGTLLVAMETAILTATYDISFNTLYVGQSSGMGSFAEFTKYSRIVFYVADSDDVQNIGVDSAVIPPPPGGDGNTVPPTLVFSFYSHISPKPIGPGPNTAFQEFTPNPNSNCVLTLVWDGQNYVQQSFSQN